MSEAADSLSDQDRGKLRDYLARRLTIRRMTRDAQGQREAIVALLQKCAGQRFRHMDATLKVTTETKWTYSPAVAAAALELDALMAAERESGLATAVTTPQLELVT